MKYSKTIRINRTELKKGSDLSLPAFTIDGISKEQSDVLIEILLNEYYNEYHEDTKGGEDAIK